MLYPSWAAWTDRRRAMFIQDFVQVDRCFDEVRTLIRADPRALLVGNARDAYRDGERFFVRLEPSTDHPTFGKKVQVELAEPYECQELLSGADALVGAGCHAALSAPRCRPRVCAVGLDVDADHTDGGLRSTSRGDWTTGRRPGAASRRRGEYPLIRHQGCARITRPALALTHTIAFWRASFAALPSAGMWQ